MAAIGGIKWENGGGCHIVIRNIHGGATRLQETHKNFGRNAVLTLMPKIFTQKYFHKFGPLKESTCIKALGKYYKQRFVHHLRSVIVIGETCTGDPKISANRSKKFIANKSEAKSMPCKYSTREAKSAIVECMHAQVKQMQR